MAGHPIVDLLETDHRNLRRLLELAEIEVDKLDRSDTVDLELLGEILEYANGYPTLVHRPREETVFELLRRRGTSAAPVLEIQREHESLARAIGRAQEALNSLGQDANLPRDRLLGDLRNLIAAYRGHMTLEERLFAEARHRFDAGDWSTVEKVGRGGDPLFDSRPEARYRRLAERLTALRA